MNRIELRQKREHDKRIQYQKSCRKIIRPQIEQWKIENNAIGIGKDFHLDHVIPFALIVDCWRTLLQKYYSFDKLPTAISELSETGRMFAKYHRLVAELELIPAEDNLSKASSQTRKNEYGLSEELFKRYAIKCRNSFLQLTGGAEVYPVKVRIIKPENSGKALQEYDTK